jgi:hypothetical protein
MKYLIISILLHTQLFSIKLIEPNIDGRTSIFIYHSGKALVNENRVLEIEKQGELALKIVGISSEIIDAGIQINAENYIFNNFSVISDFISEESLLQHFEGSKILLQDFAKDKTIDATLISYNNSKTVFGLKKGVVVNPQLKPIFPYIPEHLENEVFIKTSGLAEIGNGNLDLSYFTTGLSWEAEYHLVIIDEDKAILNGNYQIINNTETSFLPAEIYLIASSNSQNNTKPFRVMHKIVARDSNNNSSEVPEAVEIEDVEIYKVPQKITLNQNSILNANFIKKTQLSMNRLYTAKHYTRFDKRALRRQKSENLNPTDLILILNSSEKLKAHFPKGKLNIYENKDGLNMFINEKHIPKTSKGKNIQLKLQASQEILHKFTYMDINETSKGIFVTIEAEFKNLKDKNISVNWIENSSSTMEKIESSIDFDKVSTFELSAKVEVKAGETRKETITLFTPKRD